MTNLRLFAVFTVLLAFNSLQAQSRASATSKKNIQRKAWTACKTCPIVWYSTAEELAEIKRKYYNKNKEVNSWGDPSTFDPFSQWSWERKTTFWNNADIKILPEWKEAHKALFPNDKTCK